jgi:acetyl esterase/lipase
MGGVPGLLATPDNLTTDNVLMYIHGGAYIVSSRDGYRGIGGNYAKPLFNAPGARQIATCSFMHPLGLIMECYPPLFSDC